MKGFTLIELLIVVAIIAILASIAIPVFQKHQKGNLEQEQEYILKCFTASGAVAFEGKATHVMKTSNGWEFQTNKGDVQWSGECLTIK